MSFSFKTTFKLRQETPLIHFQHDQSGATLRATEVKPKLDKFLLRRYEHDNPGTKTPKNWFLRDTDALDYKLRFECDEVKKVELGRNTDYDIYYGNMGGQELQGVIAERIKCAIVCLNNELREHINNCVEEFFIVTNFGRMQRKGFGSFRIVKEGEGGDVSEPSREDIAQALCKEYRSKYCYSLPGGDDPFKRIKALYGIMKSGYNFGGTYHKSLLFKFMQKEGFPNEKRGVKVKGIAPKIYKPGNINSVYNRFQSTEFVDQPEETFYYVRALLGLADRLEFNGLGSYSVVISGGNVERRTKNDNLNDNTTDRKKKKKATVEITHKNKESEKIERLKSPIFFKIIGNRIYYVGEPLNSDILGKEFTFSSYWNDATGKVVETVDKTGQAQASATATFRVPTFATPKRVIDDFLEYVYNRREDAFNGVSDLEQDEVVVEFKRFDASEQEVH